MPTTGDNIVMDIEIVITSIVSSLVTSGILAFTFKLYFSRLLDFHFSKRMLKEEHIIRRDQKYQTDYLDKRFGIYPEIAELTHRLKNTIAKGKEAKHAFEWNSELPEMCALLTERLYTWRFFIPNDLFEMLHEFKHVCQDLLLVVDYSTRKENITRSEQYSENIEK